MKRVLTRFVILIWLWISPARALAFDPPSNPMIGINNLNARLDANRPAEALGYPIRAGVHGEVYFYPGKKDKSPLVVEVGGNGPTEDLALSTEWIAARLHEEGFAFAEVYNDRGSRA